MKKMEPQLKAKKRESSVNTKLYLFFFLAVSVFLCQNVFGVDLSRNENFKVMCWEANRWNSYPLNKMTVESKGNCIDLTNSIYIHSHVKVVYDKIINGDFKAEIELQGDYRNILLMGTDGQDRVIYFRPSEQGIDTKIPQKFIISRRKGEIKVYTASGQRLHVGNWYASYDMQCYIGVDVPNGQTVKICSLKVEL